MKVPALLLQKRIFKSVNVVLIGSFKASKRAWAASLTAIISDLSFGKKELSLWTKLGISKGENQNGHTFLA
jgi:hypothetical protein